MRYSLQKTLTRICERDPRYQPDAYYFLLEALEATVKSIRERDPEHGRHITGGELLEGVRLFALEELGAMAFTVFAEWGIHKTEDFGEMVFNLVECGRLGKSEKDSRDDFKGGYDFQECFRQPFEPDGNVNDE